MKNRLNFLTFQFFSSKFNTDWCWNEEKLTIQAIEIWSEHNRMSDLKEPVSVDLMVEHMLTPLNNQTLRFEGAAPDLAMEYHRSLAQCCIDPSKLFKVIDQVFSEKLQNYLQPHTVD